MSSTSSTTTSTTMQLIDFFIFCGTTAAFLFKQQLSSTNTSTSTNNNKSTNSTTNSTSTNSTTKNTSILDAFEETTNKSKLEQALKENKTLNATEKVCTVSSENVPTPNGHLRSQMRLNKLWHRATYIIVRHVDGGDNANGNDNDNDNDNTYLLVQRRSNIKDYCPGKLDPTPGGVVGYNESYQDNAIREIEEEMNIQVELKTADSNIDTNTNSNTNTNTNTIQKLFTFPYQDDVVNVWGELYEVTYKGKLSNIIIQPEEVSELKKLSISQIQKMMQNNPNDWMPDGLYALQLYIQRKMDMKMKKRLLKGYSSSNLVKYNLRPKPKVIFFDCDDCLYFDGWKVANQLTAKIEEWCTTKKQLPKGKAYELYKKHGTALRGLIAEGLIGNADNNDSGSGSGSSNGNGNGNDNNSNIDDAIDEYLRDVHDIPIHDHLSKDDNLRQMILAIDPTIPKFIFTASVRHHAERCLKALGIDDLFIDIIDVKTCNLATKHSKEAFEAAMKHAGVNDPECCLFLDDSVKNIEAARSIGWRSILVGTVGRDCGKVISTEHAEHEIDRIHDMPKILPELFQ